MSGWGIRERRSSRRYPSGRQARCSVPEYRREQLDLFTRYLDGTGVAYDRIEAGNEPITATLQTVVRSLTDRFRTGLAGEPESSPEDANPVSS